MVLIQHLFGIPSLRQTQREIQVNLAYRWFLGYGLLDEIPHFATVSYAFCKRFPEELTQEIFEHVEDSSIVMLRMENCCQCVVQSNINIPDEASNWRIEIFGDRGRLIGISVIGQIDGGTLDAMFVEDQVEYDPQQSGIHNEGHNIDVTLGNMYEREITSFSNSILNNTPLEVPAQEAVQVQRIVEAAYKFNDETNIITL